MKLVQGLWIAIMTFLLAGCAPQQEEDKLDTYDSVMEELQQTFGRYQVDLYRPAPSIESSKSLQSELNSLKRKIVKNEDTTPALMVIDFKINLLESDVLLLDGFKWGDASTTEPGFGCKRGSERIVNSTNLRTAAVKEGREALKALTSFTEQYPDKAVELEVDHLTIASMGAAFLKVEEQVTTDRGRLVNFCKEKIDIEALGLSLKEETTTDVVREAN